MRTVSPGFSVCWVKQKHWILVKYLPTNTGVTLNVAVPVDFVIRSVGGGEERHVAPADVDRVRSPLGLELPGDALGDIAVEGDGDLLADAARRAHAPRWVVPLSPVASQNMR